MMNSKNIENRLGIYEKALNNKFSIEEKLLLAQKAGFDYLELSIDESDFRLERLKWTPAKRQALLHFMNQNQFFINSICLSGHRRFPFGSKSAKVRQRANEIMEAAIKLAFDLRIPLIQLAGYDVYYEEATPESDRLFKAAITKSARLAAQYNIILAFETMDTEYMSTITKALEIVKENNLYNLQIYADLGNLWQWTYDLDRKLELLKGQGHYVAFHFKATLPQTFRNVPWEKSNVDYPYFFKILKSINYQGPFTIEMWSQNEQNESPEEALKVLAKAQRFFFEKWKNTEA